MKAKFGLFVVLSAVLAGSVYARIGDTKREIGDRMFAKTQHAYVYTSREDRLREALELPYKHKILLFPSDTENFFLYKKASTQQSTQGDTIQQHELYGWELHIVCQNGKSVMEFYRRQGDPMTVEELAELMQTVKASKTQSQWRFVDDVFVSREWKLNFKNDKLSNKTVGVSKNLVDILPVSNNRFIYVEIPEAVLNDGSYKTSLCFDLMTIESRKANAKYRDYIGKQVQMKAAKTSKNKKERQNAPAKVNEFKGNSHRGITQSLYNPQTGDITIVECSIPDVFLGDRAPIRYDKSIQILSYLPKQEGTAFGYIYETEDKSVRAMLYKGAILFIDAEFDKSLRAYMDELYKKQSSRRVMEAQNSISHF